MRAALATGALALWAALLAGCSPAHGVPILLWHSVGEGARGDPHDLDPEEFDAELFLLEDYGVTPITLTQLFDARDHGAPLPARPVILTFDDGRQCLHDHAAPLLLEHHVTGELFLVTDYLAEDEAHRHREPSRYGDHPYLLNREAEEMARSGAFIIESHSVTHRNLETLSEADQLEEMAASRAVLRARFGAPVDFFAYPYGGYLYRDRELPQQAGYRAAVAVTKGFDTRYSMHRLSLWRGAYDRLQSELEKQFGPPIRPVTRVR